MTLLHIFIPKGSPQVHRSRGVGVIYKFIERSSVTQVKSVIAQVKSGIDSRANILGASYNEDALHTNRMKSNHLLSVPFPISYTFVICSNCGEKTFTNPARRYTLSLGGENIACYLPYSWIPVSVIVVVIIVICTIVSKRQIFNSILLNATF